RLKILGVWAMVRDDEMIWRPEPRPRSVHEQMGHHCVSADNSMNNFFSIDIGESPLPAVEARLEFMRKYAHASARRLESLGQMTETWLQEDVRFLAVLRSRALRF